MNKRIRLDPGTFCEPSGSNSSSANKFQHSTGANPTKTSINVVCNNEAIQQSPAQKKRLAKNLLSVTKLTLDDMAYDFDGQMRKFEEKITGLEAEIHGLREEKQTLRLWLQKANRDLHAAEAKVLGRELGDQKRQSELQVQQKIGEVEQRVQALILQMRTHANEWQKQCQDMRLELQKAATNEQLTLLQQKMKDHFELRLAKEFGRNDKRLEEQIDSLQSEVPRKRQWAKRTLGHPGGQKDKAAVLLKNKEVGEKSEEQQKTADSSKAQTQQQKVADKVGELDDKTGDKIHDHHCELTYQVNVSGYRPEELNAEIQGNQLVLVGDHKEQNQTDGQSLHRWFEHRRPIPEDINRESIKCELSTDRRRLCVTGKKHVPRSILIQIGIGSQPSAIGRKQKQPKAIDQ